MKFLSHEEAFVRAFVRRDRRGRLLHLVKKTGGLHDRLCFLTRDLDPRHLHRLPGGSDDADVVEQWLRDRGASEHGYVMSQSEGAGDGEWRPIRQALEDGYDCTVVSCLLGVLAYYREEGDRRPWLLYRKPG